MSAPGVLTVFFGEIGRSLKGRLPPDAAPRLLLAKNHNPKRPLWKSPKAQCRVCPGTKANSSVRRQPSSSARFGLSGSDSSSPSARANSHCLTSPWTASSARVTSCDCGPGRRARRANRQPGDRHAAEDSPSGAIRDYGTNSRVARGMDPVSGPAAGGLPLLQSPLDIPASSDAAICAHRAQLDPGDRIESGGIWYAHDAAHQGFLDLSPDQESQGSAVAPWAFEAREHSAISRHRRR